MALAHDVSGNGPTLVLLHGGGHCRQAWDSVGDHLRPHRRVVVVDLPGCGLSPPLSPGPNPLATMLDDVVGLIDDIRLANEPVHAAGNSLGGWLALALAARGQVTSATALSPAGFWRNRLDGYRVLHTLQAMRGLTRGLGDARIEKLLAYPCARTVAMSLLAAKPSRIDYQEALAACRSMARDTLLDTALDWTLPALATPDVPMTIAWGRRDLIAPVYQLASARRALPDARFLVVDGVGHVPMTDNPTRISDILLEGSAARQFM